MLLRIIALTSLLLQSLFMAFPLFADNNPDYKAFLSGQKSKYDSTGNEKAKGLHFTIEYPSTWVAEAGKRPDIVQVFTNKGENKCSIACTVLVKNVPLDEASELSGIGTDDKDFLTSMVDSAGGHLLDLGSTKVEGLPTGWVSYSVFKERAGFKVNMICLDYVMFYKPYLIVISYQVGGVEDLIDKSFLNNQYQSYILLFKLMLNSFIIQDKY